MIEKTADLLIQELQNNDITKRLKELWSIIEVKYQNEIKSFKAKEQKFTEIKQYGVYHPDYEKAKKELHDARIKLDSLDEVKEYKRLEKELQKLLDMISDKIKGELL